MTEIELVGSHDRGYNIPGWVDGKTQATVTWKGTDGSGPWSRTVYTEREAISLASDTSRYENIEPVSAVMEPITDPALCRNHPDGCVNYPETDPCGNREPGSGPVGPGRETA